MAARQPFYSHPHAAQHAKPLNRFIRIPRARRLEPATPRKQNRQIRLIKSQSQKRHPHRNALRSALIGEPIPKTDLRESPIRLKAGDKFLLASDGMQTLTDQEIAAILKEDADALDLSRKLLRAVEEKNRRGQDNTTAIVVAPFRNGEATPIVDWTL